MLNLVLDRSNPSSFTELVKSMEGSIKSQVTSFTMDPMLSKSEDLDSLYNLALVKVAEAVNNFVYDSSLNEVHNERRFLALVKKYIRHQMIDYQYAANVNKRRPKTAILSMASITSADDDSESMYEPPSKEPSAFEVIEANEFDDFMREQFCVGDELKVYNLLSIGYPPESIAGKLGLPVSRVRYIIYDKIQKKAARFV